VAVLAAVLVPEALHAGAWTQLPGHGQLIVNLSYTKIAHEFDAARKVKPFDYGGEFRKLEINPYFEYGLTPRTTITVNAFLPADRFSNRYGSASSFGLGDVEAGVRRRLNPAEARTAVSAQATLKVPAYSDERNPAPGNHQVDAEAGLVVGRGADWGRHHTFVNLAAAYRFRAGAPADEVRTEASWGFDLTRHFSLLVQTMGITGLRNDAPNSVTFTNPNVRSDFDLYKGQVSLIARASKTTQVQLGWIDAFAGRNTGHGQTFLLAIWRSF
jgi:protein XagA